MAQLRYIPPMLRELGSTKSRIWQTVNDSPRAAQLWREIFLRAEELMAQGVPDGGIGGSEDGDGGCSDGGGKVGDAAVMTEIEGGLGKQSGEQVF